VNSEEEKKIIVQVCNGQTHAFEVLVNTYKGYVFTLVVNIVKSEGDAEEITMDSFMKAYQKIHSFRFQSKFSTWLYTIAYRLALMHLHKNKHLLTSMEAASAIKADNKSPMELSDQQLVLQQAMKALTQEENILINLFYFEEQSLQEIETITTIKANTAKVKIHRGRKKLADILKDMLKPEEIESLL
jgi:RNA polymerase sigma factor (sigma-70 family)